ncbi:unnamed protein product [Dibothriocephalus latus]|uniref:Helicase-associated domain-containing protein n=1 Tax=Dibothriocephalus latus TaxID=60516 RepID=A0A3P7LU75_DIBLA|nr:unnamed protein product [Dibothriocephalus latus]
MEPPRKASVQSGLELLKRLGALSVNPPESAAETAGISSCNGINGNVSEHGEQITRPLKLTPLGRVLSAFPLEPRLARTLVSAANLGCLVEAITAVSMLYVSPVFYVPQERREDYSEVSCLMWLAGSQVTTDNGVLDPELVIAAVVLLLAQPDQNSVTLLVK